MLDVAGADFFNRFCAKRTSASLSPMWKRPFRAALRRNKDGLQPPWSLLHFLDSAPECPESNVSMDRSGLTKGHVR
jgi:hypothetical protein